jgi:hypothetical protein
MNCFVETHWGDLVALAVLAVGVILVVFGPHERALHLGEALTAAALVGLKLRSASPANGSGDNKARETSKQPPEMPPGISEDAQQQERPAAARE